ELELTPRLACGIETRNLATAVMGETISLPVLTTPAGVQAVHPDGELAVARAAATHHTIVGLSSFASRPMEEIIAANPQTFFQIYWLDGRDFVLHLVDRARQCGVKGLILTLDWSFSLGRDWGSPWIPDRV